MAHPKRRHSKTRRDKRRTHDRLNKPQFSTCPKCKQPKLPHRICPHCGYYNGRQMIEIKAKRKKRR